MTRVVLLTVLMLLALGAAASAQITHIETDRFSIADRAPAGASTFVISEPAVTMAAQTGPPNLNVFGPRRRGSMVGYIDDPIVSSKIRVRFEMGMHNRVPDRAEFFYAKCGCYRDLPANDPAYDPDAPGPGPGIADDLNFQQLYLLAEYATAGRFSAFAELPIRWLQPQTSGAFGHQTGISDLRAGVKFGLASTEDMSITAQVKTFLATGDAGRGLGTDHASIEPGLLYQRNLSERAAIATQFSWWIPLGGSNGVPRSVDEKFSGSVLSYGIGPSVEVYSTQNLSLSPVVELVGWHVLSGFQTTTPGDASGTNIVNLKFGARASFGNGSSIYGGYGLALTDASWYEDIFRFEYRLSF